MKRISDLYKAWRSLRRFKLMCKRTEQCVKFWETYMTITPMTRQDRKKKVGRLSKLMFGLAVARRLGVETNRSY